MNKYIGYTYEIQPIEVEIATGRHAEHPDTKTGYIYLIHNVYISGDPEESNEWYDTESEAVIAAEQQIEQYWEGNAPDYEIDLGGQLDWDKRRRMGE